VAPVCSGGIHFRQVKNISNSVRVARGGGESSTQDIQDDTRLLDVTIVRRQVNPAKQPPAGGQEDD
jgi:hypothetical protein